MQFTYKIYWTAKNGRELSIWGTGNSPDEAYSNARIQARKAGWIFPENPKDEPARPSINDYIQ